MTTPPNPLSPGKGLPLESLLRRGDIWRGDSRRFIAQKALATGYDPLNKALLNEGWPLGALIEVYQPVNCGYAEWSLLAPALQQLSRGYIVLLNPPAMPFAQGLMQLGIDMDRLLVVQSSSKPGFIQSFIELARAPSCSALLAWQTKHALSYADLRKCLLAIASARLVLLFRHNKALQQNSPAALRLLATRQAQHLQLEIRKQKGLLNSKQTLIELPLPAPLQDFGNALGGVTRPSLSVIS